ncbi:unnamed protein product [Parascedosporium putredinis]|uniref:Uncharacterized protein n=1 Tax=Parascedosporium putredinis TaxID=1442378 RepID=A0A9P1GW43_9PEZI|nr:unnamed protein product [Parascedosporium putredinis]CAI7988425.1 unnamed protein product [Parascedosporium putredinis]
MPDSRSHSEAEVRSWGFSNVFTWTDQPPHSHDGLTTHLILQGRLTITYPGDEAPERVTHGVGERVDVDAGRVHEQKDDMPDMKVV